MKNKNIFYLIDESAVFRKKVTSFLKSSKPKKLIFLPLTINEESRNSIIGKIRDIDSDLTVEVLDFTDFFNKKAFSIKNTYIKLISEFANSKISPEKNVKEYFKFPFREFSIWWFSLIAEKNTLKSDSYHRLVKFVALLDIQKKCGCNEIWLDISDRALLSLLIKQFKFSETKIFNLRCHSLKTKCHFLSPLWTVVGSFVNFARFLSRVMFIKMAMGDVKKRKDILRNSDFLLVTYFPLIDKEKIKENKFIDKYYEPLQIAFESYKKRFSWLALIVDFEGYDFKKSVSLGKLINRQGHCLFFCEEWFGFADFFIVLGSYIYIALKFLLKKSHIAHNFKYPEADAELWPIFRDEWFNSFIGNCLINGLIFYRLFNNAFRMLKQDSTILYTAEMHAWEKALNIASRETGRLKTVGIQHTIVPSLFLNYFNDRSELLFGDNIQKMPAPSHLGCTGRIPAQIFRDMGWPEEKIFLLGAMRFQHLKTPFKHQVKWQDRSNIAVVVLSIMPSEVKEVLQYVYYAFRNQASCRVLIKSHPACAIQTIIDSLDFNIDEKIFRITDKPLRDILPSAKVMIVTKSSSTLEAIACGCPVVIPRLLDTVDMNPLTGVSNLGIYVSSPVDLRKAINRIMESELSPITSEKCERFIKNYFELLDSNEDFLWRIENLNKGT